MCSPSVKDLSRMRNNPDFLNWMAVGEALVVLSNGLRKHAEKKMKEFHALITKRVGGPGVKCHCKYSLGKKPNPHGQLTTSCIWARMLKTFHVFPRKGDIPWHQSHGSKWDDPVHGYWEIAKLFMSDLGKNQATTKDPSTTDSGPLLTLFIFCNYFKIQQSPLGAVKDWRNKWAHAPDHTLSDKEKKDAFADIDWLITDPELACVKEIEDCREAIKKIESTDILILPSEELKISQECRHIQECHSQELKKEIEVAKNKIEEAKDKIEEAKDKIGETFKVFAKREKLVNILIQLVIDQV
ncbi:uncharacterized protein LOC114522033 isoform X2 [Dendronephthya gigantea]|uniref:uncharacterized protein LOC114522033 isoform X2 n=1 Tax=Dendronephthya gigantea TaxID=151771 RepID=UPI0010696AF7|nr:uncharacterized protein LOC114522033 isoform X2 [Dendronephthya gigantea]